MFIPGSINIGGSGIYGNVLSTNITNGKTQPIENLIDTTVVPSTHDMSDIIGQGKGTLYCEFNCTSQIDEVGLLTLSDGTVNNRLYVYLTSLGVYGVIGVIGGVTTIDITGNEIYYGLQNKILVTYENDNVVLYFNGFKIDTDISGDIATNFDQLDIGQDYNDAHQITGTIDEVAYYKSPLVETQAIKLTKSIYLQDETGDIIFDELSNPIIGF